MVIHQPRGYFGSEGPAINPVEEEDRRKERLTAFVSSLESEAKRRVDRRQKIERRWLDDLRQYHGIYDQDTQRSLQSSDESRIFVNMTRPKTDAMIARLWDLLFPTDDKNWAIAPTPVPELTRAAQDALQRATAAREAAEQSSMDAAAAREAGDEESYAVLVGQAQGQEREASDARAAYEERFHIQEEAKLRAGLMEAEIDDQLKTCRYQSEARDMIEDKVKIGTGVLKGPVVGNRTKERWVRLEDGTQSLEVATDEMPAAHWVDPWSFFPDPDARRVEDSEGFFERHLLKADGLRKLARRQDMDKDAIREILRGGGPTDSPPAYLVDLQDLTGQNDADNKGIYTVWEYTGPIDAEQLETLVMSEVSNAAEMYQDLHDPQHGEIDPLSEIYCRIWFCNGRVLSFAMHPLDSNEPIYSVANLFRDETSLWGYGIPYVMRDPQSMLNAAMRMMMDNAALATGPQVVVNKSVVKPQDGKAKLSPRKIWERLTGSDPRERPFETFAIDMHQIELANIVEMARRMIDEMTSMPQIAQGEQGSGVTKTAQGMALLMNSANVVFRRVVRNFDDDVTVPLIRRFYHWNMQFSDRHEMMGDYDVVARGSSVLLVREMQSTNLLMIAQLMGDDPDIDQRKLKEEIFKAHNISATDILRSEADKQELARKAQNQVPPEQQLAMAKAEAEKRKVDLMEQKAADDRDMHQSEWSARVRIEELRVEAAMISLSEKTGVEMEKIRAKMQDGREKRESDERKIAAEIGTARQTGQHAGGSI